MSKVINYVKDKYKIFVPIIVFLVLIIISFYYYSEYKYELKLDKKRVEVYKEVLGGKVSFNLDIYSNKKSNIKKLEADKEITFDSNPIYYAGSDSVIFSQNMSVIFPYENNTEYSTSKYVVYEKVGNLHYLINDGVKKDYLYFFMYDGDDLYFFIDDVTLYIDNSVYKTLSGMSYVQLVGDTLIVYNKEEDTSFVKEISSTSPVVVKNDFLDIDLRINKIGSNRLLNKNLDSLTKLANKKENK